MQVTDSVGFFLPHQADQSPLPPFPAAIDAVMLKEKQKRKKERKERKKENNSILSN